MVRLPVAFDFSKQFERDYDKVIHITSDIILKINHILNFFRNVCAHDEILYNFKVYKFFKDEPIFINTFNNYNFTYKNDGSLFNAIAYLQLVTPKEIFNEFLMELDKIIDDMICEINTFTRDELYEKMGFNNIQFTDGMELLKNSLII